MIKGEYEEAIGHMKAALENDPTDYTLWNKLGAVQTHSSQVRTVLSVCVGACCGWAYERVSLIILW